MNNSAEGMKDRTYLLIAWWASGSRLTSSLSAKRFTPAQ